MTPSTAAINFIEALSVPTGRKAMQPTRMMLYSDSLATSDEMESNDRLAPQAGHPTK